MSNEKGSKELVKIYKKVYSSHAFVRILQYIDVCAVAFCAAMFGLCLYRSLTRSIYECIIVLIGTAVPFVAVSVLRKLIKAERPYQVYDFSEFTKNPPHHKMGSSFPSRHVFSAFIIGTVGLAYSFWLGIITLIFGVVLAISRVLLGIHFTRDVVCGMMIGIAFGIILLLIL